LVDSSFTLLRLVFFQLFPLLDPASLPPPPTKTKPRFIKE
jgi:hypothetical protein